MGYLAGVSSGMFSMAQPQEKIGMIDLSQKAFYSAFKGVNFTQIDLERSTEFVAPELQEKLKRIRNLNIQYGIHGLCGAMGSKGIFLDSAVMDDWVRTHISIVRDIDLAGKFGAKYYLQHASETTPYGWLGKDMQSSDVVDIWGRPLWTFLEENESVANWIITQEEIHAWHLNTVEDYTSEPGFRQSIEKEGHRKISEEMIKEGKLKAELDRLIPTTPDAAEEFAKRVETFVKEQEVPIAKGQAKKELTSRLKRADIVYAAERIAYLAIGRWMSENKDPIWLKVVGDKLLDKKLKVKDYLWVPAVSLKYIWGHFNTDKSPTCNGNNDRYCYEDPKKYLEKHQISFVIETAMVGAGMEREYRLTNPKDFVILCKQMEDEGCPWFRAAIDFEHILGAGIEPMKDCIEKLIPNGGKYINTLHVGWPTPVEPAHVPIYLGSEQQEWLYNWMLELKKRGFNEDENRYIIFERAGGVGGDAVDQSGMAIKKIIDFLRKDVPVKDLSKPENLCFYGIDEPTIKLQETEIREHAMDPIRGLLQIPEEQHGFIGGTAVQKGKAKEWEAAKMR